MRTTRKELVEKEITTYACDFCDFTTENNRGCCGVAPIMYCNICGKDCCHEHREFYTEDHWSDYPDGLYACPECQPRAYSNFMWLEENAARGDDIVQMTIDAGKKGVDLEP